MGVFLRWIGLGGGILTLAAIAFLSSQSLRRVRTDTAWVDHTHQVLSSIATVRLLVSDAASNRRGLATNFEHAERDRYDDSQRRIDLELARLTNLVRDNPDQEIDAERLQLLLARWRSVLRNSIAEQGRSGFVLSVQAVFSEQARLAAAAVHDLARRMSEKENQLLVVREEDARASAENSRRVVITGNCLGLLLLMGATTVTVLESRTRRRAETALQQQAAVLKESKERYQTLYNSIDEGFCIIEMIFDERDKPVDYRFLEINPAFAKQTGLLDARGKTMRELAPLHEQHWFETYGRIAVTGEPLRFQNWAEQLNRWYDVYAFRFGRPENRQVAVLFNDITERKQLEKGLRESEELVQTLGENVRDYSIFLLDEEGRVQTWNHAAERMKGYAAAEVLGKHISMFYTSDDLQAGKPQAALTRAAKEGRFESEGFRVRKDGSLFWADVVITAIPGENGRIRGFAKITRNIDEKHAAEEKMRRQAAELATANQELEAFSYSVSHDLRAPLRAIDGFSQALLEESGERLDEEGKRYLGRVRAGAQRMAELIDDLLSLSKVSQKSLDRSSVDLSEIAADVFAALARAEPDRKVAFELARQIRAEGDEGLLRIVLQNLIGNAWKFTSKRSDAEIEFGVREDGGERRYFVRDNGSGFDQAYAGKLFGAFQRLHTEREFSGTGIGLATVARIVHRHGGKVGAEGRVGEGATFWFTL